eukprot:Nk52_evm64s224 gene=Nk52_evmTU64s224
MVDTVASQPLRQSARKRKAAKSSIYKEDDLLGGFSSEEDKENVVKENKSKKRSKTSAKKDAKAPVETSKQDKVETKKAETKKVETKKGKANENAEKGMKSTLNAISKFKTIHKNTKTPIKDENKVDEKKIASDDKPSKKVPAKDKRPSNGKRASKNTTSKSKESVSENVPKSSTQVVVNIEAKSSKKNVAKITSEQAVIKEDNISAAEDLGNAKDFSSLMQAYKKLLYMRITKPEQLYSQSVIKAKEYLEESKKTIEKQAQENSKLQEQIETLNMKVKDLAAGTAQAKKVECMDKKLAQMKAQVEKLQNEKKTMAIELKAAKQDAKNAEKELKMKEKATTKQDDNKMQERRLEFSEKLTGLYTTYSENDSKFYCVCKRSENVQFAFTVEDIGNEEFEYSPNPGEIRGISMDSFQEFLLDEIIFAKDQGQLFYEKVLSNVNETSNS